MINVKTFTNTAAAIFFCLILFMGVFSPSVVLAHEVYVLPDEVIDQSILSDHFSFIEVVKDKSVEFIFWAFVSIFIVIGVFFISISRTVERYFDPFLAKLPPYAPVIGRITVGLAFLLSAYHGALFGPELPLENTYGSFTPIVQLILYVVGVACILGYRVRLAATAALILFAVYIYEHGIYMFTYANYAGELALLFILGAHKLAFHHYEHEKQHAFGWIITMRQKLAPYAFVILRVLFGMSLLYASVYAKVIHNELALAVTTAFPAIHTFFGFEPQFLVLGAAIIEIMLGLFFILGIEIRFTALFMLFWLSLSLWYFGEAVWPHIILIGLPMALICYGYDRYSLEGYFFKRDGREPVL